MKRRSIYIEGFAHKNPIPAGCRMGNMLMTGIITGMDPATGKVAATLEAQCAFMFQHVRSIMQAAGGSTDDVIKMSVWMADRSRRAVHMHRTLGIQRGVIVQPTTYGADHQATLDGIAAAGPNYRGCANAAVFETADDAYLEKLHAGGVRGARFSRQSLGIALAPAA